MGLIAADATSWRALLMWRFKSIFLGSHEGNKAGNISISEIVFLKICKHLNILKFHLP